MKRLSWLLIALPALASADIHYQLKPDVAARSIRVSVRLDKAASSVEMRIPAWCPGFYFLQNYHRKISSVRATNEQGELGITKKDDRGWVVSNPSEGPVTFSYSVLGDDPGLGFFGVNVVGHTAFVNGPAGFMYPAGRLQEKITLKMLLPEGWKVATGMNASADGTYTAQGYDEFIDHPIQVGIFERRTFIVGGVPFEAVFVSPDRTYSANLDYEAERLRRLSIPAVKMFGGFPWNKYVYIIHLSVGNFGGGLEHRGSTVMAMANEASLDIGTLAPHEYFHTWNVKQFRPRVLGPFDYTQPVRTRNLWFAEGVTDYYANLHAYRSGLEEEAFLLRALSSEINQLQSSKMRLQKTVEQASWEAWENGGFGVGDLSYYNKGLVAGFIFDAVIRSATEGEKSLDDVLKLMYKRYRLPNPGYEENGILLAMNEVSGGDMSALYRKVVQSTEEMPYEVLNGIGLEVFRNERGYTGLRRWAAAPSAAKARLAEWLQR